MKKTLSAFLLAAVLLLHLSACAVRITPPADVPDKEPPLTQAPSHDTAVPETGVLPPVTSGETDWESAVPPIQPDDPDPSHQVPDAGRVQEGHTDRDGDGYCDECGQSVILYLNFYAVNDLHGKFHTTNDIRGVEKMTSYLEQAGEQKRSIVLSAGDMWQGGPESNATQGRIVTDWMKRIHTSAMAIGNHEFDFGEEAIRENLAVADFPFLALNIFCKGTNERPDYCRPSRMIEKDGLRIGIIGAIGDCYSSIAADKSRNVFFKVGDELTELVRQESMHLRAAGADFIVYVIHDGYGKSSDGVRPISSGQIASYYDTALSDGYVDAVFEGHTHQSYVLQDEYGVYHLQGGGENRGLTHLEAAINFANGDTHVNRAEYIPDTVYRAEPDHPLIADLLREYEAEISPVYRVLGRNDRERSGSELRKLTARLYYETGMAFFGDRYDLVLGGGFISVRSPYRLPAGDVTYAQLQTLFPFDNQLVLCSISGYDLREKFFETSNRNYFIYMEDYGEQVLWHLDPDATYYLVTDTYTSTYAPNHLTEIERYTDGIYARDLIGDYIRKGGFTDPSLSRPSDSERSPQTGTVILSALPHQKEQWAA